MIESKEILIGKYKINVSVLYTFIYVVVLAIFAAFSIPPKGCGKTIKIKTDIELQLDTVKNKYNVTKDRSIRG